MLFELVGCSLNASRSRIKDSQGRDKVDYATFESCVDDLTKSGSQLYTVLSWIRLRPYGDLIGTLRGFD